MVSYWKYSPVDLWWCRVPCKKNIVVFTWWKLNTGSTVVLPTRKSSVLDSSSTRIASKKPERILDVVGRSFMTSSMPPRRRKWCRKTNVAGWVACLPSTSSTRCEKWNTPSPTESVACSGMDRIHFTVTDRTPVPNTARSPHQLLTKWNESSTPLLENHRLSTGSRQRLWNPVRTFSRHSSPGSPRCHSATAFFHLVSRSLRLRHCWRSRDWTAQNQPTTDRFQILTTSQRYSKDCS